MPTYQSCICSLKRAADLCGKRRFVVGANWKMNGNKKQIIEILKFLKEGPLDLDIEIYVAVPFVYLERVKMSCLPENCELAAQNCYKAEKGAYTGEISPTMLRDIGCKWVILGHSERRQIFKESDELVAEKCKFALQSGLKVAVCVGETKHERDCGKTMIVIQRQLRAVADQISCDDWKNLVIAYEPVWAIGTGKTATPQQAQEVHQCIRKWLAKFVSDDVAKNTRIQYGGSVTANNSKELVKQPDIDGFLVGGASLTPDFVSIVNAKKIVREGEQPKGDCG